MSKLEEVLKRLLKVGTKDYAKSRIKRVELGNGLVVYKRIRPAPDKQ